MAVLQRVDMPFVCTGDGTLTIYTEPINGFLQAVFHDYTDAGAGADITITEDETGRALLTITNAGAADCEWKPQIGGHPVANTTAGTNSTVRLCHFLVKGRLKVVFSTDTADNAVGTLSFFVYRPPWCDRVDVPYVLDGDGVGTFYSPYVNGFLHAVMNDYTDNANTMDLAVTEEDTTRALLTITNAANADGIWYPHIGTHPVANTAGGSASTVLLEPNAVVGRIKTVVAQGGAAASGIFRFYLYRDVRIV